MGETKRTETQSEKFETTDWLGDKFVKEKTVTKVDGKKTTKGSGK